jgi:hypothetical protein
MSEMKAEARETCDAFCPVSRAMRAAHEVKESVRRAVPEEFWKHRAAARRETLLALRSLIDAALERTETKPLRKATTIKVE